MLGVGLGLEVGLGLRVGNLRLAHHSSTKPWVGLGLALGSFIVLFVSRSTG